MPTTYELTVYLLDSETGQLEPWFPRYSDDTLRVRTFAPGQGATGSSWSERNFVTVTEDAVSDGTFGLSSGQQEFFAPYRAVAATPIWLESRTPVGVLSAIGRSNDGFFDADTGSAVLRELADVVGVVLQNVAGVREVA